MRTSTLEYVRISADQCGLVRIYADSCGNMFPISYIQYENIPIRDSPPPHPTPPHPTTCWGRPQRGRGGHGVGGVGWGGIPYGYISILDIGYWIYIFCQYVYMGWGTTSRSLRCSKEHAPYRAGAAWPMPRTGPGRPAHAPGASAGASQPGGLGFLYRQKIRNKANQE